MRGEAGLGGGKRLLDGFEARLCLGAEEGRGAETVLSASSWDNEGVPNSNRTTLEVWRRMVDAYSHIGLDISIHRPLFRDRK